VSIRPEDLRDSRAIFTPESGAPAGAAFGDGATVALRPPETACATGTAAPSAAPMG
jgi:hypothetical protein